MNQQSKMVESLEKVMTIGIYLLIFTFPLFFLPITNNALELNKHFFITGASIILSLLWAIKMVVAKKMMVKKTPFDLPLVAILAAFVLSTIFSQNKTASLIGLSGSLHWNLLEFVGLYLLYYVVVSNLKTTKEVTNSFLSFIASSFLVSVINLLSYFSILKPSFVSNGIFNPVISPTNLMIVNVVALVLGTKLFVDYLKNINTQPKPVATEGAKVSKTENKVFVMAFGFSLFTIVTLLTIFLTSPFTVRTANKLTKVDYPAETFLSLDPTWNVALDTFQNVPLTGSGPSTFLFNYNRFRPQNLNSSELWSAHFTKGNNEYLGILSELGLLGIVAFAFLLLQVVRILVISYNNEKEPKQATLSLALIMLLLISFAFTFSTVVTAFLLFMLLALAGVSLTSLEMAEDVTISFSILREGIANLGTTTDKKVTLKKGGFFKKSDTNKEDTNVEALPWVFLLIILAYSIFIGYELSKFVLAEYSYKKALDSLNNNEAVATYEYLQNSINYNPYRDKYRNTYAQTSLLLANAISQGEELTDQDRLNIEQLLQQSVNEVRISTEVLTPQNSANWKLRGEVYKQLIGVADGAENWAVDAYRNAIALDPNNPLLRLELGSIYYQLEKYDEAIKYFQDAALLKTDYVNAYYNLSVAYKDVDRIDMAYAAMQQVSNLLPADSPDRDFVNKELESLQSQLPEETTETTTEAVQQ